MMRLCYLPDKVRVLLVNRFPRKCTGVSRSAARAGEIFAKDVTFDSGHLALLCLPLRRCNEDSATRHGVPSGSSARR